MLLITGPIGSGKSSVMGECMALLDQMGVAHAAADLDALNELRPRPAEDYFQRELGLRNLASIWANYQEAGATRLMVAGVVETRADIDAIGAAISGSMLCTVRLRAPVRTLQARAVARDPDSSWAQWHVDRAAVLAEQMEAARLEDEVVENGDRPLAEVALEVLRAAGWQR